MCQKSIQILEELCQINRQDTDFAHHLSKSYVRLGDLMRLDGKLAAAEDAYAKALPIATRLINDNPQITWYAMYYGIACWSRALLASDNGQSAEALEWYARAIEPLETVTKKDPTFKLNREHLSSAYVDRSEEFRRLGQTAESLKDWNRALQVSSSMSWDRRMRRAKELIRIGKYQPATAIAATAATRPVRSNRWLSDLAQIYTAASKAARGDDQIPEADRDRLGQEYATQADELRAKADALVNKPQESGSP